MTNVAVFVRIYDDFCVCIKNECQILQMTDDSLLKPIRGPSCDIH
jgi:hypothetical protein